MFLIVLTTYCVIGQSVCKMCILGIRLGAAQEIDAANPNFISSSSDRIYTSIRTYVRSPYMYIQYYLFDGYDCVGDDSGSARDQMKNTADISIEKGEKMN